MNDGQEIEQLLSGKLPGEIDAAFRFQLQNRINDLLNNDFQSLIQLLYSMDVDENKLKGVLEENPSIDAAIIITDLLIERQKEKIATKNRFNSSRSDVPDNEK